MDRLLLNLEEDFDFIGTPQQEHLHISATISISSFFNGFKCDFRSSSTKEVTAELCL